MATYTFDGTSSLTATKDDTVFITASPQSFAQATDNGLSVSLNYGAATLTITGTTLVMGGLPNVYQSGGQFSYAGNTNTDTPATTGNILSFLINGTYAQTTTTTADSKVAIFGGLGRVDAADGADSITFGGKGSFLVYGDAGADSISQTAGVAFDSTSTVNVNGDGGNDTITLVNAANKASIYVGGGDGADTITVRNSGATFIQGGTDSTDGGDLITLRTAGDVSTSYVYGNGGADSITVMGLDTGSNATVYGGFGNDSITATSAMNGAVKATINVLGGEGADTITVTNAGNTYITGGNQSGDQSLDGADSITFSGSGNALVFGNVGADSINLTLTGTDSTVTSDVSVYGGKDNDLININASGTGKATIFAAGGENSDNITVTGNGGAVTIYGGTSSTDSADGADTIAYSSSGNGAANIFGNGGADSIRIDTLGNFDSTSPATVTVQGGGGNDSITVSVGQSDAKQALVLTGNEGSDTFSITKGTGQTITVSDFTVANTGGDQLALTGLRGANTGNLQVTPQPAGGSFQTLQQALDAASNASGGTANQNKAAAVVFGGSTYVVIEAGGTGFQAGTDQAIKLTGVTDLVGLVGQTTLSGGRVRMFDSEG